MSKIALSGNASGTGTLTIAAPNTSTDRTLTLPDESGSVLIQNSAGQQVLNSAGTAAAPAIVPTGDTNTGIFFPAADTIAFAEGGAEAMRIDSSGRVGIGTTSPTVPLQVDRASSCTAFFKTTGGATTGVYSDGSTGWVYTQSNHPLVLGTNDSERMRIDSSGNVGIGTSSPVNMLHLSNTAATTHDLAFSRNTTYGTSTGIGGVSWYSQDGTTRLSRIASDTDGASTSTRLTFSTSSSGTEAERMRIDSSGNLLVGATSQFRSGDRLTVSGTGASLASFNNLSNVSGYGTISSYLLSNGGNTSTYHFWANTSAVGNWYLYGNGTSSFSSDERLKKNIETTRDGYVDDLCRLRVVKYNWKDSAEDAPKELGLIAQEVEQVFPGLVQDDINPVEEDGETYKQLKHSVLPFMLLKAIQELKAITDTQAQTISALEARIAALETQE